VNRIYVRQQLRYEGVAHLVVGRDLLLTFADDATASFRPGEDALDCLFYLCLADGLLVAPRGQQGSLIEQVL